MLGGHAPHRCSAGPCCAIVLSAFRRALRALTESLWDHFEITLGSLWGHFVITFEFLGVMLGSVWDRFRIVLGTFWDRFGIVLGWFWDRKPPGMDRIDGVRGLPKIEIPMQFELPDPPVTHVRANLCFNNIFLGAPGLRMTVR